MAVRVHEDDPLPATDIDWAPVLAFLPWLQEDEPEIGTLVPSELQDDGSWSWPYEALSPRSEELVDVLHTSGVVAAGIDWSRWLDGRGDELVRDRGGEVIGEASLDDCRRLLVALVRQSRFVDGVMLDALRDGRVRRTFERVAALTA